MIDYPLLFGAIIVLLVFVAPSKRIIPEDGETFLREGKTRTNRKSSTTSKPKIKPAPQSKHVPIDGGQSY